MSLVRASKGGRFHRGAHEPESSKPASHGSGTSSSNGVIVVSPVASRTSANSTPSPHASSSLASDSSRSAFNPDRLEHGDPDAVIGSDKVVEETLPRNRVGLVFDERMAAHRTAAYHPEQPERIKAVFCRLEQQGLAQRCVRIPARSATPAELGSVHSAAHVQRMLGVKDTPQTDLDRMCQDLDSVYLCPDSTAAALLASGSVIEATKRVCSGAIKRAACVVRLTSLHIYSCACIILVDLLMYLCLLFVGTYIHTYIHTYCTSTSNMWAHTHTPTYICACPMSFAGQMLLASFV